MNHNSSPIIPGEVLINQDHVSDYPTHEPLRMTTDAEALALLPGIYIGYLGIDRVTGWPDGASFGAAALGGIVTGLAAVTFLENRGIIKTEC